MKIGIAKSGLGFTQEWIKYCESNGISYKLVDCFESDIIHQLKDCDGFMWQHDLLQTKDNLVAKRLLTALEHSGKICFPSILENWHYDDKLAQKYLLEAIDAPLVPTYIFYDKDEALNWIDNSSFPKVFKLNGGAGSINVKLIKTKKEAYRLASKAFGKGFDPVSKSYFLKESYRKYKTGELNFLSLGKSIYRYFKPTQAVKGFIDTKQKNYMYFQDYIPGNNFDIRLVVLNKSKAFGLKRYNRKDDFRASGSGDFDFLDESMVSKELVKMIFEVTEKLKMDSVAYDIIFDKDKNPLIIEITYAYASKAYNGCPGYWSRDLIWHNEILSNYQGWMVEGLLEKLKNDKHTF